MLWDKGILNTSTPKGFFRAVFYYNGKTLCLEEDRSIGNFRFHSLFVSPIAMSILKMLLKNRSGGLAQLHVVHKKVPIYANPAAGECCHVYVLDKYLSKLPAATKEREAAFIGKHWQVSLPVLRPWFTAIPVGKNSLGKVVSEMFCAAGIKEKKTNHSLRAAGVSQSFEAGVDEKDHPKPFRT